MTTNSTVTALEVVNEMDFQKKTEDEHLRLQRQVRMIQTDRQNRIGVHPMFRRQDVLMRTLRREYINLLRDLKIARSGAHKKKDKKMKSDLKRHLLLRTKTGIESEGGNYLMEELDGLLKRNNKYLLSLRKQANVSKGELEERRVQSESRLMSMENKLETAMLRFNSIQFENMKIREEIEHMLKDRALFNQSWDKMLVALKKGKKFLTDLFESSTVAYDQRDEWCAKLKTLQEKGRLDQTMQLLEMRDLQKAFDHEMKLYEFLSKKGIQRVNNKQKEREEQMKIKEEEDVLSDLKKHSELLDEIYDHCDESDTGKIIEDFTRREQEMFSIYKLLTDYCAENVALGKDLNKTRRELEDRMDWNDKMASERETSLQKYKKKKSELSCRTAALRDRVEEKTKVINNAMTGVKDMFRMLGCSLEPFQNLLGDKQPSVHQLNLTFCLMTEKITDYVHLVYYYERFLMKKEKKSAPHASAMKKYTIHPEEPDYWTASPIKILVPADPCPACIEARWLSRVTDIPEAPFNREQVLHALTGLKTDPAYITSDRLHVLEDCRLPESRAILGKRYV